MTTSFSPIPELNLLKDFEDTMEAAYFSDGFELWQYGGQDPELIAAWIDLKAPLSPREQSHVDRLIPFAQATGSGSFYALWQCDDRLDLSTLPVVFFGDEGDLDIAADGMRQFFQVLALDTEHFLADDEEDEDEDDEEHRRELSKGHAEYLAWLKRTFNLGLPEDPLANPHRISDAARKTYGQRFVAWLQEVSPHKIETPVAFYR
ncbi:hypothetical protein ACIBLA_35635 [Streptomyces sp. NPDC050433]|uniref:hypothetical protein n=1 Tax=unclassified Streptomyces TaxID=2593676 RepID=UPI00341B96E5